MAVTVYFLKFLLMKFKDVHVQSYFQLCRVIIIANDHSKVKAIEIQHIIQTLIFRKHLFTPNEIIDLRRTIIAVFY